MNKSELRLLVKKELKNGGYQNQSSGHKYWLTLTLALLGLSWWGLLAHCSD